MAPSPVWYICVHRTLDRLVFCSFLVGCVSPTIKVAASVCSIALAECCLLLVFMLLVVGEVEVDVRLEVAVGPLFWLGSGGFWARGGSLW